MAKKENVPLIHKQFVTNFSFQGQEMKGECLVEVAGYVPIQKRIEQMIAAGERLHLASEALFDYPATDDDEVDEILPPFRRKNYDLADAFQDQLSAVQRVKDSVKKASKKTSEGQNTMPLADDSLDASRPGDTDEGET